jgi:plastocyanin
VTAGSGPRAAAAAAILWVMAACGGGGGSPSSPTAPPTDPVATSTITITTSGVSPRDIVVSPGTRVVFINNDVRPHNMSSDPHPDHTDCQEINQVGFLTPGQRRETGNLNTTRTCGYHDHDLPSDVSLQGRIVIR